MHVAWTDPFLLEVDRNHSWTSTSGVVELPHENGWSYVVIEIEIAVPRRHDIVVTAQESDTHCSEVNFLAKPSNGDSALSRENGR
ncbi:hypothetical protein N7523_006726 [Penicillium sp. IBT 18751x]|nr:hypothetical protein N7523_006726 [Penicillium sp. IBT 18751x]